MSGIYGIVSSCNLISNKNTELLSRWNSLYGSQKYTSEKENFICGCFYDDISTQSHTDSPICAINDSIYVSDALIFNRNELLSNESNRLSDEEIISQSINNNGFTSLKDINGEFAGAVYNSAENKLTLFRDHVGSRPLFYYYDSEAVAFSTDIRGLLSLPFIAQTPNRNWIFQTIEGHTACYPKETEVQNIYKVLPGTYITFSLDAPNSLVEKRYWVPGKRKIRFLSNKMYSLKLRGLIEDSIKIRANVFPEPLGAELSGGLDSSTIDILLNRMDKSCIFHSWSVSPDELPYIDKDERLIIKDICDQENITCHYSHLKTLYDTDTDLFSSCLKLGLTYDASKPACMRFALPAYANTIPLSATSEYARKNGARVVFTGHGGDEGVSHRCSPYEMFYNREYYHYLLHMWSTTQGQKYRIIRTAKRTFENISTWKKKRKVPYVSPFASRELLLDSFKKEYANVKFPALTFAYDPITYVRAGFSTNRTEVSNLFAAYSGVRYTFPYLDYRVIDYAISIPRYLYLKGNLNRYIFRDTFKDILPNSLYNWKYKEDFSTASIGSETDWYEEFRKNIKETLSYIDRAYWKDFLNFSFIDSLVDGSRPADTEKNKYEAYNIVLFQLAMFQNCITELNELIEK